MKYLVLLLLPAVALATERPPSNPPVDVTTTVTGGDQLVNAGDMNLDLDAGDTNLNYSGSRAYAFAHGLGGVSISQCMASTQWGSILVSKQRIVLNRWCAAEVYDAKGLYDIAARMRCDIPEVASLFASGTECRVANTVTPPPVHDEPSPVADIPPPTTDAPPGACLLECTQQIEVVHEEIEEVHEEQMGLVVDMAAKIADIEEQQTASVEASSTRRQQRRDYAQQMIEKLNEPTEQ